MTAVPATPSPRSPRTRNDAFKERFSSGLWFAIIVATVLHFVAFLAWPTLQSESWVAASAAEPEVVRIDEYDIPPPPDQPTQPKRPTPIAADVSTDITIEKTVWDQFPPDLPPPPRTASRSIEGNREGFTPFTVGLELRNTQEVLQTLERIYPSVLKDAGIGGTVILQIYVGEDGHMLDARIRSGGGHDAFDQAALRVAEIMRFTPALNRDRAVAVWIEMPIQFKVGAR